MDPSDTTKSNYYQDEENYFDIHDSSEDNHFYDDNFDQKMQQIDSTLKHSNDEDFSMDWYYSALEEILSSMDNVEADSNATMSSSIHALFGNETMSLLEQELFFENEVTSFDIENHEDVIDDLTETIFSTIGADNKESGIDNSITETVVRSGCTEINNNDYSPKEDDVIEFTEAVVRSECTEANNNDNSPKEDHANELTSVLETPSAQFKTMLAEKIHQPDEKNSPNEAFHVIDLSSSLESTPEQYETTPSEANLQPEENILGENYLFELKCRLCNKKLSVNECMSHKCDEEIKITKTFSCKKCERTFYDKAELNTHEKTHFSCSICGRNLAAQFSLKRHYRLVHGKTNVKFI